MVLVSAVALTWVLHRAFDPVPKAVAGSFGAVVLALFAPVLFGGKYLLPLDGLRGQTPFKQLEPTSPPGNPLQGDLLQLTLPLATEVERTMASGRWPLWSDRLGAGMPLLADPQAQALQPLAAPGRLLAPPRAAAVTAALRVWTALLFTWLLLRRQGLGAGPAWFGALAWGLGGFLQLWLGWPLANSAALLPGLLYAVARLTSPRARRDVLLLAGLVFAVLVGGHPETILYSIAVTGAFLFVRLRGEVTTPDERRRTAALAGIACVLGAGLAAPALLPTAELLPETLRALHANDTPALVSADAARRLALRWLPIAVPNAFGNDRYGAYWGASNINEDAAGFMGTATLLLALLALLPRRSRRPQELFLMAAAGISLAIVAQLPGLTHLLRLIPGGAVSGFHHRLLLLAGFGLVYLASCELDRWTKGEGARSAALLLGGALAALHLWAYAAFHAPADPAVLDVLRWGWVHWHLRFLVLTSVLLLLGRSRRQLPMAVGLAVAAELFLLHNPAHPPQPARLWLPETPALAFVREHLGPGERIAGEGLALTPNLAALYGLNDSRCYSPMVPAEYVLGTSSVRVGWASEVPLFGRWDLPFHDAMSTRFVVAPPASPPPPGLTLAFDGEDAAVWERPHPRPRFEVSGGKVAVAAQEPSRVRLTTQTAAPTSLAASVLQEGGWKVLVNGQRQQTLDRTSPFLATNLPAGKHRVDLVYLPHSFLLGCLLAGCALTALLTLQPPPTKARRKRHVAQWSGGAPAAL